MIQIAISGAAGRMGQRLIALSSADSSLEIVAAVESPASSKIGADAGEVAGIGRINVPITDTIMDKAERKVDVLIDFSSPKNAENIVSSCVALGISLVYATTGTSEEQNAKIRAAAQHVPVLFSPSMSMAVNVAMKLSEISAKTLKNHDADVEILERHHRYKVDAPSGTALKFGQIIGKEMDVPNHIFGRQGVTGVRPHHEIAYHALRVGDNPGEHTIVFGMLGETLEIIVKASSRDCYAQGALAAAKFLHGKPAGLYSMNDVLGIS